MPAKISIMTFAAFLVLVSGRIAFAADVKGRMLE